MHAHVMDSDGLPGSCQCRTLCGSALQLQGQKGSTWGKQGVDSPVIDIAPVFILPLTKAGAFWPRAWL